MAVLRQKKRLRRKKETYDRGLSHQLKRETGRASSLGISLRLVFYTYIIEKSISPYNLIILSMLTQSVPSAAPLRRQQSRKRAKLRMDTHLELTRKKSELKLKQMISRQKVSNLLSRFVQKIKLNNSSSTPVEYSGFQKEDNESIWQWEGFQPNCFVDSLMGLLSIIEMTCLLVMFTLALVFSELEENTFIKIFQIFSIIFYFIEILYSMGSVKLRAGRKLKTLQQIWSDYLKANMMIDLLNLLILLVDSTTSSNVTHFARLFVVAKLPQCLQKVQKLEVSFFKNWHNEQYWSLIKVVLFNFCFAHVLAIILTAMANIDLSHNWYDIKNINDGFWYQKYIWAYYWGVNIMLTVGFGDFYATNYKEALCLIFIEIISVMCLAYNINWVGTLITNIRAQDIQKGKKFKTFNQLNERYGLSSQLEWKIGSFIEESVNIKKKFNIEEEQSFVQSLPAAMRKEYLKESNKSVFNSLPFFSGLIDKTLYSFAQKIQMTICHPGQMLRRINDEYNLLILKEGEIGFTAKLRNCDHNDMVIDKLKVAASQPSFILGLQFLTRTKPIYQIKSLEYSVVYRLSYDQVLKILKESHMDYIHFCSLRDKNNSILDEFQVFDCTLCKNNQKHTKFTCPKLHFVPLRQIVICREKHKEKQGKNKRFKTDQWRIQSKYCNALTYKKKMYNLLRDVPGLISDKSISTSHKTINQTGNAFVDKLLMMKRQKQFEQEDLRSSLIEDQFGKSPIELIKQEFNRHFKSETYEDEVWTVSCDRAKIYKEYFPESNPCFLMQSLSPEGRPEATEKAQKEKESKIRLEQLARINLSLSLQELHSSESP